MDDGASSNTTSSLRASRTWSGAFPPTGGRSACKNEALAICPADTARAEVTTALFPPPPLLLHALLFALLSSCALVSSCAGFLPGLPLGVLASSPPPGGLHASCLLGVAAAARTFPRGRAVCATRATTAAGSVPGVIFLTATAPAEEAAPPADSAPSLAAAAAGRLKNPRRIRPPLLLLEEPEPDGGAASIFFLARLAGGLPCRAPSPSPSPPFARGCFVRPAAGLRNASIGLGAK
jgi:hypothetical protein